MNFLRYIVTVQTLHTLIAALRQKSRTIKTLKTFSQTVQTFLIGILLLYLDITNHVDQARALIIKSHVCDATNSDGTASKARALIIKQDHIWQDYLRTSRSEVVHLCWIDLHDVKDKKIQAVGNTKVKVIAEVGATYLSKSTNAKYLLYDLMISHFVSMNLASKMSIWDFVNTG